MQENSNKAIAINSLLLYAKLIIVTACELLATRFALQALGIVDFGLFSVIGSIISFIAVFNTIMISTSNRFISVAIGKGDITQISNNFSICLFIHIIIAIITILLFVPLGDVYILNSLNYEGDIMNAMHVFHITIVGSVISFVGVPYNGLLVAKEKFVVYSLTNIIAHIVKLLFTIALLYYFSEKLLLYGFIQAIVVGGPTLVYYLYCKYKYRDIVKFRISKDKQGYKEIFSFSGWVAFGAFACIGRSQGAAILINLFFNTTMNTALGLANSVNVLITNFANSVSQPIAPQITKSYASGNDDRTKVLLVMSTKYTYLVTLLISIPFLCNPDWLFALWLGEIPEYVVTFSKLIIIDALVTALNSGLSNLIFANGNIKLYQVSINVLRLLSIVAAYFILRFGCPPISLLITYILFSIIVFFVGQRVLNKTTGFDNSILWKESYFPSFVITVLLIPTFFIDICIIHILNITLVEIYAIILIYLFGMSRGEKNRIKSFVKSKIH